MVTNGPLAPLYIFSSSNRVETASKDSLKHFGVLIVRRSFSQNPKVKLSLAPPGGH